MTEALKPAPAVTPGKAIPEARDRRQSAILASTFAIIIAGAIVFGFFATGDLGGRYKVAGVSLGFAAIVSLMRAATIGGAAAGALACFCITWWTRDLESPLAHSALPPLMLLFILTFAATRLGRSRKLQRGLAERATGRTASQVMANLGVAALVVTPLGAYAAAATGLKLPVNALVLSGACIAALAEATADTVSSETGQAFGHPTYMLTNLRRVHRGTDGGVSATGTASGAAAALLVVLLGAWSLLLPARLVALIFVAAMLGFLADSLLGATLERRGWIGNDVVNLSSTAIAALVFLLLASFVPAFTS